MPIMTYQDIMKKVSDSLSFLPPEVACIVLIGPRNDKSKVGVNTNNLETSEALEMLKSAHNGLATGEMRNLRI